MSRLEWASLPRDYDSGVDRGVLYFGEREFVPWNGLVSVEERVIGLDPKPLYFDGVVYNLRQGIPDFTAAVEAFSYPYMLEEHILAMCDTRVNVGTQNDVDPFHLTYRVSTNDGYKIHLAYNVVAVFEGYVYETINDENNLSPFTFTFHATPEEVPQARHTAHFVVDSTKADSAVLGNLEDFLYGSEASSPKFPTVSQLIGLFTGA
jgi:hypothetical protein